MLNKKKKKANVPPVSDWLVGEFTDGYRYPSEAQKLVEELKVDLILHAGPCVRAACTESSEALYQMNPHQKSKGKWSSFQDDICDKYPADSDM